VAAYSDNEGWIVEAGDDVIAKKAREGAAALSPWEQLVYCLWVADYMMRNAGNFSNAEAMYPAFDTEAARLAEHLGLRTTHQAFSLARSALQEEYFDRFEAICDEIRHEVH
jgi:hypothetical protein